MRKHTILAPALLVVLPGCHGRGPVGDEADAVYVAAYGYLIQYRTHFFTVAVDQVCLDGPDARRMAWRMRRSYIRVRADCPDGTPGFVPADWGHDSVPVMRLAVVRITSKNLNAFLIPFEAFASAEQRGEFIARCRAYLA